MKSKHILTPEEREEALAEARENDRDMNFIRAMYTTPGEIMGEPVELPLHFGRTVGEVTDVDVEEERVTVEELFTGEEYTKEGLIVEQLTPGTEFTVEWIEARIDGEWERVTDLSPQHEWMGPHLERGEEYDTTRLVSKTYEHGAVELDAWDIRLDSDSESSLQSPSVPLEEENVENPDLLNKILNSIDTPQSSRRKGLVVGTVYTQDTYIQQDGETVRKREIVWWDIDHRFRSTMRCLPSAEFEELPV